MPYDSEFRSVNRRLSRIEILVVVVIALNAWILLKLLGYFG